MYPQYMCILLYVTLIWCNGIPYIYCQLELWGVDVSVYVILLYVHSVIVVWRVQLILHFAVCVTWYSPPLFP